METTKKADVASACTRSALPEYLDEKIPIHLATGELSLAVRRSRHLSYRSESVLLIHGLGCAKESFDGGWAHPLHREVPLIAVDLPGFGDSPPAEPFLYRLEDHAAVLKEVVLYLELSKVHLIGHSMGGAVAVLLGHALGERLGTLVNVEGNLVGEDCALFSRQAARVPFERFENRVLVALMRAVKHSPEPALREMYRWLCRADHRAIWMSARSLVEWSDSGELLRRFQEIARPRYYLFGDRSVSSALASLDERIHRRQYPACGHFVMQDAPQLFWDDVARAVRS